MKFFTYALLSFAFLQNVLAYELPDSFSLQISNNSDRAVTFKYEKANMPEAKDIAPGVCY